MPPIKKINLSTASQLQCINRRPRLLKLKDFSSNFLGIASKQLLGIVSMFLGIARNSMGIGSNKRFLGIASNFFGIASKITGSSTSEENLSFL